MTDSTKTQYLRLGLGLAGISASDKACETIWKVYEGILKKEGEFSISDAVKIESEIDARIARAKRKKTVTAVPNEKK